MLVEAPRIRLEGPDLSHYRTRKRLAYRLCLYATVAVLMTISGCAIVSGNNIETGVRAGFETAVLKKIAIMPFSASDLFSMTEEEQRHMLKVYEETTASRLEAMGFETIAPGQILDLLKTSDKVDEMSRLKIDRPLPSLYESDESNTSDDRRVFLQEINAQLGADAIFIGQVVYHTTAECENTGVSPWTPHVVLEAGEASFGGRVPCAVSHFEAKLIDRTAGRTFWYNRALRELRAGASDAKIPSDLDNARATVDLVLTLSKGLGAFAPR